MNGHDEETYERKDLHTAFISREEHEAILKEYKEALKNLVVSAETILDDLDDEIKRPVYSSLLKDMKFARRLINENE